jgi:hypothetical protein
LHRELRQPPPSLCLYRNGAVHSCVCRPILCFFSFCCCCCCCCWAVSCAAGRCLVCRDRPNLASHLQTLLLVKRCSRQTGGKQTSSDLCPELIALPCKEMVGELSPPYLCIHACRRPCPTTPGTAAGAQEGDLPNVSCCCCQGDSWLYSRQLYAPAGTAGLDPSPLLCLHLPA